MARLKEEAVLEKKRKSEKQHAEVMKTIISEVIDLSFAVIYSITRRLTDIIP